MVEPSMWHEDAEFWETFRDYLFPPEKVDEEAAEQVDQLLALLDPDPDARVLDVPCGVGRHAVELAERGLRVTGVDATKAYLDAARERVREVDMETNVELVEADMRKFRRSEAFDAVLNVYTSFGYFEDRGDDERTARNFYESLKPGGTLVMSLTSKEVLAGKFEKRTWGERDGTYVLEEHEVRDDWSWMENRWIVVADGAVREFTVSHRLYSAFELSDLLERVGFDEVTVYGDLDGSDFDENAEKLVVVAQK
jgi:SAM-dependent methyltransferase